jgi:hypothetical protein
MRGNGGETGGGWYHGRTTASPVGGQPPAPLVGKPSPAWATPARKEVFRPLLRLGSSNLTVGGSGSLLPGRTGEMQGRAVADG